MEWETKGLLHIRGPGGFINRQCIRGIKGCVCRMGLKTKAVMQIRLRGCVSHQLTKIIKNVNNGRRPIPGCNPRMVS